MNNAQTCNNVASTYSSALEYYDALGWYMVPLHTPIFNGSNEQIGCICGKKKCKGKNPIYKWNSEVFPIRPSRTTTLKALNRYPEANIGVITGIRSNNLVVLDFDNPSAFSNFIAYLEANGYDPRLLTADKGKQGFHIYFNSEFEIHTRHTNLGFPFWNEAKGIDLLANGGHCVIPPSKHVSGLLNYEWLNSPLEYGIPSIPEFLVPYFKAHAVEEAPLVPVVSVLRPGDTPPEELELSLDDDIEDEPLSTCTDEIQHGTEQITTPNPYTICVSCLEDTEDIEPDFRARTWEEKKRIELLHLMKHTIPASEANAYYLKYANQVIELFPHTYEALLIKWFGLTDETKGIAAAKAQERINELVSSKLPATLTARAEGKLKRYAARFSPEFRYYHHQPLIDLLTDEALKGVIRSKDVRLMAAKVVAYFLDCHTAAVSNGQNTFFRGFEYIVSDIRNDTVFAGKSDAAIKKALSRIMPFFISGYRCDARGTDFNRIPIFECVYKASPISKGIPRDTRSSEYKLNDTFRCLLEMKPCI